MIPQTKSTEPNTPDDEITQPGLTDTEEIPVVLADDAEVDLTMCSSLAGLKMANGKIENGQTSARISMALLGKIMAQLQIFQDTLALDPGVLQVGDPVIYTGAPLPHPANKGVKIPKNARGFVSATDPLNIFVQFEGVDDIAFKIEPEELRMEGASERARIWNEGAAGAQDSEAFEDELETLDSEYTFQVGENERLQAEVKRLQAENERLQTVQYQRPLADGEVLISSSVTMEHNGKCGKFITYFVPEPAPEPNPMPKQVIIGLDDPATTSPDNLDELLKSSDPSTRENAFQVVLNTHNPDAIRQAAHTRIAAVFAHAFADTDKPMPTFEQDPHNFLIMSVKDGEPNA